MKKQLLLMIAVGFTLLAVAVLPTQAQEEGDGGSGFRISPTRYDLSVEQGEVETRYVTVRNVTSEPKTTRAIVNDFIAGDESGAPRLVTDTAEGENPYSIRGFIQQISDVTLEPGEEKEIAVTIAIPDSAAPGSYYGVVRFIGVEEFGGEGEGGNVALSASVGTLFLIQVPGETNDLLTIEQVSAVKDGETSGMFSSAPTSAVFRLKNEGNTFQAPFGRVLIKNFSGDVVYEYELNDAEPRGNVLPGSIRRFENEIENIGSFGRYTIEANISYGDGSSIITATSTFWVIPWGTVIAVGAGVVVLAFLGTRGIKAYNRKIVEGSKGTRVKKK